MPSRGLGEAHAVPRTTLSFWRTIAAPWACFARYPVSIVRVLPPARSMVAVCFIRFLFPGGPVAVSNEMVNDSNQRPISVRRAETHVPRRRYASVRAIVLSRLFADAKFLDDVFITLCVVRFQIVQQAAALADHHQKTPPGGVVLLMALEVLRQLSDSLTQYGNLYFRAARI